MANIQAHGSVSVGGSGGDYIPQGERIDDIIPPTKKVCKYIINVYMRFKNKIK